MILFRARNLDEHRRGGGTDQSGSRSGTRSFNELIDRPAAFLFFTAGRCHASEAETIEIEQVKDRAGSREPQEPSTGACDAQRSTREADRT